MNNKKFKEFLRIRDSGLTNMFNISKVVDLSNRKLTREDVLDIIKNFHKYLEISEKIDSMCEEFEK